MRKLSKEGRAGIKQILNAILKDNFPVEMKIEYLTEHFATLFEHIDEKAYERSIYAENQNVSQP